LILILKSTFNNYDIITLIIIDQFSCFLVEESRVLTKGTTLNCSASFKRKTVTTHYSQV